MISAIRVGDVLEQLSALEDCTFDAVLSDPPYGLKFMASRNKWDHSVPSSEVWAEILRVLRPGGHVLSFGGTRTYHRMVCAIEDGGLEVRDQLAWIYGSGMPKGANVSKAIDKSAGAQRKVIGSRILQGTAALTTKERGGTHSVAISGKGRSVEVPITAPATEMAKAWDDFGTNLKPALEPICLARRPLEGKVHENVLKWGCGALAIGATRIGESGATMKASGPTGEKRSVYGSGINGKCEIARLPMGRWPANVIMDEEAGAALDAAVGNRPGMSGGGSHKPGYKGGMFGGIDSPNTARGDQGGPSRFFYSAKVSPSERNAGLEKVNNHSCLKPIALTTHLAKLLLPPNTGRPRRILVPYSGTGSEMIGALLAGWDEVVGIEMSLEYAEMARDRIAHHTTTPLERASRKTGT